MTAKLGPSMIALGEPASAPIVAETPAAPADAVAAAIDEAPLQYPFPGGKVPIIRASSRIVARTPLNYPAPAAPAPARVPATDVTFVKVSPSIIAMAEPEPPVSFEEVAALDRGTEEISSQPHFLAPLPTVIRGGVVDEGGAGGVSMPAAPTKKPATAQRSSSTANAQSAPGGYAVPQTSTSAPPSPPRQPDVPIPSPTPAPPPAGIIPQAKIQ